uniref:UORF n=1 Tax=Trypanosoma cruzi TaxID=5693 RepID=A0A076JQ91_TRYCR|nr:uORF [Trypanosoma cruzi]
MSVYNSCSFFY